MSYLIRNKIALVTGSNRGIGKAIVESFISHGAAKIYAGVRDIDKADALITEYGDKIVPIVIDYAQPETIATAEESASDVEVVVSNAGILLTADAFADNVIETFEQELDINVYGLLRMAKAFGPVLKANGGGAFVQLNSIASLASFPGFSTYCASKAAAYSFTQALRPQFKEQGTALLSVHPGPISTDMAKTAGIDQDADPPEIVSEGIVSALAKGSFHLFPDAMAKQFEEAYRPFAQNVVEAEQD